MSSSVPLGSPNVTFAYEENAKAFEFNHLLKNILPSGIYEGGVVSVYNSFTLTIPTHSALYYMEDGLGVDKGAAKVSTEADYNYQVFSGTPPADDTYYLYGLFTWSETPNNYPGYYYRSTGSGTVANELIFGTFTVSGGSIISVSPLGRKIGNTTDIQILFNNLTESYGFTYSENVGAGTTEYPQYIIYTKGTTIIRLNTTWSLMTNSTTKKPNSIIFQLSLDNGTTYANMFTKTYTYSSDLITSIAWS